MAKKNYIGVDNIAHEVKKMYIGVDNIARKVKRAYIGDENGLAKLIYSTSYNIRYVWDSSSADDRFATAVAGDTIRVAFQYDDAFGPPAAIVESAVNGFIYFSTGDLQGEDWDSDEIPDYEFSFTMPPDDINVYILTWNREMNYKVQSCSYQSNVDSGIMISSYPSTNYVEAGTNMSMRFYCRYSGNVTLTLTNANTGAIYETKTFKNFVGSEVYSFLMPFSDVNIQLTYEGIDLVRYILYIPEEDYTLGVDLSVNLEYLPGIPTSAQVGEEVDLTPWFGENSTDGYKVKYIDSHYDAREWVVGDGQGDLTFNMPSESIYVVTKGVPFIGEIPDDWDCDIDGHDWVQTAYYPPDCINIGERYYMCVACGEERMEEIDTIDHVLGTDDRCKLCGQKLK